MVNEINWAVNGNSAALWYTAELKVQPANSPIGDWRTGRTLISWGLKELEETTASYKEFIKMEGISVKGLKWSTDAET